MTRWLLLLLFVIGCTGSRDRTTSRLVKSASPYLREHADNPVNWYEWGDEALDLAKQQNKPMIVSIGYSACHWCHVMERETFMDDEVARIMNEKFICIKVDREERPDIDAEFVRAAEALEGPVGWPLNAFASTDASAFHVATYVPRDEWIKLLLRISKAWNENRKDIDNSATLMKTIASSPEYPSPDEDLKLDVKSFLYNLPASFSSLDLNNGGLVDNVKFPMPTSAEFLLQYADLTADKTSRQWVLTTLAAMMKGGIFDQLGGGFSRYATDTLWRIPHFEKMLYDNGQLVSLYSHALKATGNKDYEAIVRATLEFIETEMTSPEGAFYSSIDADSEGEEGKFYLWTADEFTSVLGTEAEEAMRYYGVVDRTSNVLRVAGSADSAKIAGWRRSLFAARNKRVHPSIDQKIITSWNAMTIVGYLDAFTATGDRHYLDVALKAARYLDAKVVDDKRVLRIVFEGMPGRDGLLDDYAWLAKAYTQLYQATFDIGWLNKSKAIADLAIAKFTKEGTPMFLYSGNGQTEFFDNVIPSSNSVFAEVLLSLGEYFQNEEYTRRATLALETAVGPVLSDPMYISNWARLAQRMDFGPYQIAIVGDRAVEFSEQLQRMSLPPAMFLGGTSENLPLLENKLVKNKTMIYVCKNRTCKLPVEDPKEALRQIYH